MDNTFKPEVLETSKAEPKILDCGHPPSPHESFTCGYGVGPDRKTFCYACCAENDKKAMIEDGRATLYLTGGVNGKPYEVINWPGSLRFTVYHFRAGRHNIAGRRIDAWFTGPDGFVWHAKQYGTMSDICHCKRTKEV